MTGPGHHLGPADERGPLSKPADFPPSEPPAAEAEPDRPSPRDQPELDADGNRPTEVLPRRRPLLGEQPTTVLPRRPPNQPAPPPTGTYPPAAYPPGYPPPGYPPPGYPPPGYPPPAYPRQPAAGPYPPNPGTGYVPPAYPPRQPPYPDNRPPAGQRGGHLPPYQQPLAGPDTAATAATAGAAAAAAGDAVPTGPRTPRKITVTRVAAFRSRELTLRGVDMFHRATTADGADRSGLAHLTYAQMANYACDAALAVALANTLFLVRPEEGPGRVLLYLLITVAPFALVAPLIGPFLDRLQTGRRLALAVSMGGRGLLAIPMIFTFSGSDASWALYPCALGSLVLSKSFGVLKASLTPRVLPEAITLVATNSRLTVFGLIAGGVAGTIAAGLTWMFGSPGALVFTALLGFGGAYLCLKIPAWVESTEGEVPVHLTPLPTRNAPAQLSIAVRATLWANSSIRIETGFLAMFIAFVVMNEYAAETGFYKLMLLGLVGGAAGVGGFVGNALGAKLPLRIPELLSMIGLIVTIVSTLTAALLPGLAMAAIVGFVGSTSSSLAKVCLDSVIQRDLPEVSRASAFGRSETALQLAWVFGGVIGLLIGGLLNLSHNAVYTIGFTTASVLLSLGLVQTWLARTGRTLVPQFKMPWQRRRPVVPRAAPGPDPSTTRLPYADAQPTSVMEQPAAEPPRREPRVAGTPRQDPPPRQHPAGSTPVDRTLEMPVVKPGRRRTRRQRGTET